MQRCFQYLKDNGITPINDDILSFKDFEEIIDVSAYRDLENKFKTNLN